MASSPAAAATDFCGSGATASPLFVPGDSGLFGRLFPGDARITMRASQVAPAGMPRPWGFVVNHAGRSYINPTLVLRPGQRLQIDLENAIGESTIVHWHGLAVDTRNDGAGMPLVPAGARYAYNFDIRDRASLYWYHPHPHGLTAGQVYRGLFGLIEVEDDDERALRTALGLVPGRNEIPLILQDRRGADYVASDADRLHGYFGDRVDVNGTPCPYLDVTTRIYRFRVLNASNARTYRLGLRSASGGSVRFSLIGTDAGLLAAPVRCDDVFLSPAERIDILVDLTDAGVGDTLVFETRAFDPMHMEMPASAAANAPTGHESMVMDAPPTAAGATAPPKKIDHAAMGHGGGLPEGATLGLLQLRVRERVAYSAKLPTRLSSVPRIDVNGAAERVLRLGYAKGRWRINDRVFAMGETPIEVRRDTTETWLIRNYFSSMPHAMHLHGFHFQVLERQTSPDQIARMSVDDRGRLATDLGWKDTVLVWPGESVRIAINFSMPFTGAQTYMFHCHNLEHEDGGMMLGVNVA